MNDGYLLADCIIKYLIDTGFIYSSLNWKHSVTKEKYYYVRFFKDQYFNSTISFEIIIHQGNHLILKSSIRTLEKRFKKDFNQIFIDCITL